MSVVLLSEAKAHLNIAAATYDAELQTFIDRAEAAITRKVGPLTAVATTKRVRGGTSALALPVLPAITLTSVTPADSTAITLTDLYLDTDAGVVTYNSGAVFAARYYTVVYSAGRAACPDDLKLAVLELVRHFWETQRGGGGRPGGRPSEPVSGAAYLFPFRVQELIEAHLTVGFA